MACGRQLAVYCLDVAVIAVSGLVCFTSIAAVAYGSDHDIAYLKGGLWTCRSLSAYRVVRHWKPHGWSRERQLHLHDGVTCGSYSARRTCRVINVVDDQRAELDHKHTYIHVLSYGIVPADWLLSPFFTKKTSE